MAIYHFSAQIIKRSLGASSTSAVAYRCGLSLTDERTGEIHDYTRKKGIDSWQVLAPDNAPSWVQDPAKLWNEIEKQETRKDAQLCREINLAIPKELTDQDKRKLVENYVKQEMVSRGMCAVVAFHDFDSGNPHAHIMLTLRAVSVAGFGNKDRSWNDKTILENWRKEWSQHANKALEAAGQDSRISEKTLEAQKLEAMRAGKYDEAAQLDRTPTQHEGRASTQARRRRRGTKRTVANDEITAISSNRFNSHRMRVEALQKAAEATNVTPLKKREIQDLHARAMIENQPDGRKIIRAAAIREIRSYTRTTRTNAVKSASSARVHINKEVDQATRTQIMLANEYAESVENDIQKILKKAKEMEQSGDFDQRLYARKVLGAYSKFEKAEEHYENWKRERRDRLDLYRTANASYEELEESNLSKIAKLAGIKTQAQKQHEEEKLHLEQLKQAADDAKQERTQAQANRLLADKYLTESVDQFKDSLKTPDEKAAVEIREHDATPEAPKPVLDNNKKNKKTYGMKR